jgi:hypothetical protein
MAAEAAGVGEEAGRTAHGAATPGVRGTGRGAAGAATAERREAVGRQPGAGEEHVMTDPGKKPLAAVVQSANDTGRAAGAPAPPPWSRQVVASCSPDSLLVQRPQLYQALLACLEGQGGVAASEPAGSMQVSVPCRT